MAKIKHIAFLKFKPGTSAEQVDTLLNELLDPATKVRWRVCGLCLDNRCSETRPD